MDAIHFDVLTKTLALPGTRRRLVHVLAALSLGSPLAFLLDNESEAANRRRRTFRRRRDERRVASVAITALRAEIVSRQRLWQRARWLWRHTPLRWLPAQPDLSARRGL